MSSAVGNIDLGFSPGDFLVFYPELILAPCDHLYLVLSTITTNSYSQMKASFCFIHSVKNQITYIAEIRFPFARLETQEASFNYFSSFKFLLSYPQNKDVLY